MPDEYQRGSDAEWIKHSNQELEKQVKKLQRQRGRQRFVGFLLLILLGYVAFRYHQVAGIRNLWPF
jgi:hypothetical protein